MLFKVEQTPPRESGASLTRQWWTCDGDYSDRGDGRSTWPSSVAGQVSRRKFSRGKTRRKRNVWKLEVAREQQPKCTESSGRMNLSTGRGRRGRDGGGAGSGPLTVGEEVGGAAEG